MKRPKKQEKNEQGSALAYVLIFGVIIMILIVGLLSVGQSGIAFSQESVESRQAYIDAKSVIEFGKIEIGKWAKRLEVHDQNLNKFEADLIILKEELQALQALEDVQPGAIAAKEAQINDKKAQIIAEKKKKNEELNKHFKIYAKIENLSETLVMLKDPVDPLENLPTEETLLTSGFGQVGELRIKGENEDITDQEQKDREDLKYEFTIETKNLRRTLDYKVSFNYKEGEISSDVANMPDPPEMPSEPESPSEIEYIADSIKSIPGSIFTESQKVYAQFDGLERDKEDNQTLTIDEPSNSLDIKERFEWINGKTLDMTAHNIKISQAFPEAGSHKARFNFTAVGKGKTPGEIRIIKPYTQSNQDLNKMTAADGNIVFEQGLTLAYAGKLNIACNTLYVNGDVSLSNSSAVLDITADNIVITGDVNLSSSSTIITKKNSGLTNVWIKGKTRLASNGSSIKHLNLNYLSTGDIDLQSGTELELSCGDLSKVEMGNVVAASSNVKLEINEVNYLKIGNTSFGHNNQLTIKGATGKNNNYVKISSIQANTGNSYDLKLTNLAFFDCENKFELNNSSTLQLESDCVLIGGDLSLSFMKAPIKIASHYLDVSGKTTISRMSDPLSITSIRAQPLNIRFKNGYDQLNSTVSIDQADLVIFTGDQFKLNGDNANSLSLKVQADDINIDSNMEIKQHWSGTHSGFEYSGKRSISSPTNLHLQNDFTWKPQNTAHTIKKGTYQGVYGNFPSVKNKSPKNWLYELDPKPYQPSGSLDLLPDKEQYY